MIYGERLASEESRERKEKSHKVVEITKAAEEQELEGLGGRREQLWGWTPRTEQSKEHRKEGAVEMSQRAGSASCWDCLVPGSLWVAQVSPQSCLHGPSSTGWKEERLVWGS